ncbi:MULTISPECIES: Hsp20 family protein [Aeromonas]|jgi:molecular chaperone IbpA|uniref:Heat-shock protein n=3 Tax=Gammaproteobacteria TaxID=1236 RepID=A0A3L0WDA2_ECOLX|nr:Hsp20 family protein [Aeromonas salmonicida]MBP6141276.1 Hsp20 family protein [Aeromonas sp.]ATP07277.1 small heat shock protein IbpA [Aeromonas salmonicida subsp. pectinolytica 34mel]EQC03967.1 16 kDa heat shock protein A [Aeromonas salmonicida subsp. pectinolytica 34mel]KTA75296.1 heat-shock protein [Aeromonas salmonicida]KTA80405.1 heat-shock protein [Aeromonas salmonicida]
MRSIDFSPLYRSAIGFDRLANLIESAASNGNAGYPPYNIEQLSDNDYRISMAVAGFTQEELELSFQENLLTVKGNKQAESDRNYLYQGIAERGFERRFQLADYVRVKGADLKNGLLHIELMREVPEAMKPRKIEING